MAAQRLIQLLPLDARVADILWRTLHTHNWRDRVTIMALIPEARICNFELLRRSGDKG